MSLPLHTCYVDLDMIDFEENTQKAKIVDVIYAFAEAVFRLGGTLKRLRIDFTGQARPSIRQDFLHHLLEVEDIQSRAVARYGRGEKNSVVLRIGTFYVVGRNEGGIRVIFERRQQVCD